MREQIHRFGFEGREASLINSYQQNTCGAFELVGEGPCIPGVRELGDPILASVVERSGLLVPRDYREFPPLSGSDEVQCR